MSVTKVAFIVTQNGQQIRKTLQGAIIPIQRELLLLAAEYGTRAAIAPHIMTEAVEFVVDKFGQLGVLEIRAAYRAWASNELEIDKAEIYGGVFNVRQLGIVLEGWVAYRNRILAEYQKEKDKADFEKAEIERAEKGKTDFEVEFPKEIQRVRERAESWQDVPVYFFDAIQKRWPMKFEPGEADGIMKEAEQIVKLEIEKTKGDATGNINARINAMALENSKIERAKTIAQKISIFRKVLQLK